MISCPTLDQLPAPPDGKTGWPWNKESNRAPAGASLPSISIVVPSFNQGKYIEETIRSILLQAYPKLQLIIIDGGSTDETVDIIKRYEPWVYHWVSEPDRGQSDAINKGFWRGSGDFFQWINSDDMLAIDALWVVANHDEADLVAGEVIYFGDGGEQVYQNRNLNLESFLGFGRVDYHQPGVFIRRAHLDRLRRKEIVDSKLHYCFDWALMLVCLSIECKVRYTSIPLAHFRLHPDSKTCTRKDAFENEHRIIISTIEHQLLSEAARRLVVKRRYRDSWRDEMQRMDRLGASFLRRFAVTAATSIRHPYLLDRFTIGWLRKSVLKSKVVTD